VHYPIEAMRTRMSTQRLTRRTGLREDAASTALLDKKYSEQLRSATTRTGAVSAAEAGVAAALKQANNTHYSIVDKQDGPIAGSVTYTLNDRFGARVTGRAQA